MNTSPRAEHSAAPRTAATPSPTFERIMSGTGHDRRERQDRAVTLAHHAVAAGQRVLIQAPTGVGKSRIAIATAADNGRPGNPGIIVTTTNSLGEQYLRDCAEAARHAGFTYTRVMGRDHYACASSEAARRDGLPSAKAVADGVCNPDEAKKLRMEWLWSLGDADDEVRWERERLGMDEAGACPGFPDCDHRSLGGCGAILARARAFDVDVVITNFHLLACRVRYPMAHVLPEPAVVVVDEAHALPDAIANGEGGRLTAKSGSRVLEKHPTLRAAVSELVEASLSATRFGSREFDTEAEVVAHPVAVQALRDTWAAMPDAERAALGAGPRDPDDDTAESVTMPMVDALIEASGRGSTWRAWTSRTKNEAGEWEPSKKIELRQVNAAALLVPQMLTGPTVMLTGTAGATLPARLGFPQLPVVDLGQEFAWGTVTGWVSAHSGIKSGVSWRDQQARNRLRVAELADKLTPHPGGLVLANGHSDAQWLASELARLLPDRRVLVAPREGGSLPAGVVKDAFVAVRGRGGRAVLVGTDSYATGLDLPGDLCTVVAWWTCVRGGSGFFDEQVRRFYYRHGDYLDERFRARFAQGVGRLLRSRADRGELVVCDSRLWGHLRRLGRVDRHLADVRWEAMAAGDVAA